MDVPLEPGLLRRANLHHQLLTRADWVAAGRTARSFDRAIADGDLRRMGPSIGLLPGADATDPSVRIAAASLSLRRPALASHRTAAFLWGAPVRGIDPIEFLTTGRTVASRLPGIVVHRPSDVAGLGARKPQGIPATGPIRTLLDLGASDPDGVIRTLEAFVIAGLVEVDEVSAALARHRRPGRRGVRQLEDALDDLPLGGKPPDSVLEPAGARLFALERLEGWVFHLVVCGHELDFAFPEVKVNVEVDGWAYHRTRERFEADRARDAELAADGWVVLRFTWRQVMHTGPRVARLVASAIAHRRG